MKKKELALWVFMCNALRGYASAHGLKTPDIRPFKKKWVGTYVASCSKRGVIRIATRNRHGDLFEPYHYIDTMAHELAHLAHQNHSPEWFALHIRILTDMANNCVYKQLRKILKKS